MSSIIIWNIVFCNYLNLLHLSWFTAFILICCIYLDLLDLLWLLLISLLKTLVLGITYYLHLCFAHYPHPFRYMKLISRQNGQNHTIFSQICPQIINLWANNKQKCYTMPKFIETDIKKREQTRNSNTILGIEYKTFPLIAQMLSSYLNNYLNYYVNWHFRRYIPIYYFRLFLTIRIFPLFYTILCCILLWKLIKV